MRRSFSRWYRCSAGSSGVRLRLRLSHDPRFRHCMERARAAAERARQYCDIVDAVGRGSPAIGVHGGPGADVETSGYLRGSPRVRGWYAMRSVPAVRLYRLLRFAVVGVAAPPMDL